MKRPTRQLLRAASLMALGVLGASPAIAQDEPIVVGKVREVKPFDFAIDEVGLRLHGRYTDNQLKPATGEPIKTTQTYSEELLYLTSHGHVIHPNVFEFNLQAEGGPTQSQFETDGQADRQNGNIQEYSASGTFFRRNSTSLNLMAQQSVSLVHRPFASSLQSTTENRAATINNRWGSVVSSFRFYQLEQLQEALTGDERYEYSEDGIEWNTRAPIGTHQEIEWEYSLSTLDETSTFSVPQSYETQDARLSHTLNFGEDDRSSLSSILHHRTQTGTLDQERTSLDERLELVHSSAFRTRYRYLYDQFAFQSLEQTSHRGTAGFQHRLFKSLTTNGELGMSTQESDDGLGIDEQFGRLDLSYEKLVPYGLFNLNLFGGYNVQQISARSATVHAVQQFPFTDSDFITLVGQNIVENSIALRSPGGALLVRDRDWRLVTAQQSQIILQRILTSPVPEGPVSVEYDLLPGGDTDITTTTLGFGPRYSIREGPLTGLSVYGRYMVQTQDVGGPGAANVIGNDITDLVYGAEYRIWEFIFNVEQQHHDSTLDPYDALRYSASYLRRLGPDTSMALNASRSITEYQAIDNEVDLTYLSAAVNHQLSYNLIARAALGYMLQSDQFTSDTTGTEQELELRWRQRQTQVIAGVRRTTLETEDTDNSFLLFYVNVERKF